MKRTVLMISICLLFLPAMAKNKIANIDLHNDYMAWATKMAESQMKHDPELWMTDGVKKPKWDYTQGIIANAMLQVYEATEDSAILQYVQAFANYFVQPNGAILTYKLSDYNIDRVQGGYFLYDLYRFDPDERYLLAIQLLRSQLQTHPRTTEGGFWHKKIYPHQMWLDGLYMGETFYARFAYENPQLTDNEQIYNDVVRQFLTIDKHTVDSKLGLNYHGWDESCEQTWADKETGCSPNFWSRSIGWYMMALVDVLDYLPEDHFGRGALIDILQREAKALLKFQDKQTGMWYQVTNYPKREGNYLESTASAMFCYAMAKGARKGYLDEKYLDIARHTFEGMTKTVIRYGEDGTLNLTQCCAVAGLGGNPYRSGTYEYYINEKIRENDPKGVGPFIMAALELAKAHTHIVVAQDGTGDYKTLQEAINAVPNYRKFRTIIRVKAGVYNEQIIIPSTKTLLSIVGDDAYRCIITSNHSAKTPCLGGELGTSGSATVYADADDLYIANLTIENTAGEVGQAVAAHVSGQRVVWNRCRFLGNQDTLFPYEEGSRQYYKHCYIEGTTDFIFGWANAYFSKCEIHAKRNSYITAASTTATQRFGLTFNNCRLTAAQGVDKVYLGRPWREYAKTIFMNCYMEKHIRPEGWHNWNKPQAEQTAFYAEYGNTGAGAATQKRTHWSKLLTAEEANALTINRVLGGTDNWNPEQIRVYYRRK